MVGVRGLARGKNCQAKLRSSQFSLDGGRIPGMRMGALGKTPAMAVFASLV